MIRNQDKLLFEALASFSVPLERAFHTALNAIKTDDSISDKYKEDLLTYTKAILMNSLDLHEYVARKDPSLDFEKLGKQKYIEMREEYLNAFPKDEYYPPNFHEYICKEADSRKKKPPKVKG
ncbi:hypothetical protein [Glaciecola sp. SC05]|uniref:hypothetical protein n=1 Tax=Glaciecola sp. SC05 TaxID=1987355 RepID=UPI003528FF62